MTDDREIFEYLLAHPEAPVDEAWVRSMELKYPYFSLPSLMRMRASGCSAPDEISRMLTRENVPAGLDALLRPDLPEDEGFYPPQEDSCQPTTNQTIDAFLATYGTIDPAETATLERLIFNPVADYSQKLAKEAGDQGPAEAPTGNSQDDLINRFLLNRGAADTPDDGSIGDLPPLGASPAKAPAPAKTPRPKARKAAPETPPEDTLLSESLARIYIKGRRYDRAYEILSNLSLAFPEKSAYFADQMRFLRKLMLNEQFRKKRENNNIQPE